MEELRIPIFNIHIIKELMMHNGLRRIFTFQYNNINNGTITDY